MEEIIEAAEEVFAKKGYSAATMEEIAQQAEFAVGTLYKYFPGKAELYAETVRRGIKKKEEEIYAVLAAKGSPRERIERYLECRLSQFWEDPNLFRLLFQDTDVPHRDIPAEVVADLAARYEKLKAELNRIVSKGIQAREFREYDEEVVSVVLEGFIRGYLIHLTRQPDPVRNRALERQLVKLFLHGAAEDANSAEGVH